MARAEAARAKPARRPGSLLWLQGLGCGALVTLATPTALLAAILLVPSAVAVMFDTSAGRRAVQPVLLWGLAASVRPMVALWTEGHNLGLALSLASDLSVLATAWAAQAGGWLVAEILPLLIVAGMNAASGTRASRLRRLRSDHEAEWDLPPPS